MDRNLELEVSLYDSIESIEQLNPEWIALHRRCSRPSIFNSFEFQYLALDTFATPPDRVFFLVVRQRHNNQLVAIFPFIQSPTRWHRIDFNIITYAGLEVVDKPYPIIDRELEPEAWRAAFDYLKLRRDVWHFIDFLEVEAGLHAPSAVKRSFTIGRYLRRQSLDAKSPIIDLESDWKEFSDKHSKMRKRTRRMERSFGNRLVFKFLANPEDYDSCLNEYINLESKSWKYKERIGISRSERDLRFHRKLFETLAKNAQLFFGFLYIDDQLVSAEIAYSFGDTIYFTHGCFDGSYKSYSPGMVSTSLFIQRFHNGAYKSGDFLGGFSPYIDPWASRIVTSNRLTVAKVCPKVLLGLVFAFYSKTRKKLLQHPFNRKAYIAKFR